MIISLYELVILSIYIAHIFTRFLFIKNNLISLFQNNMFNVFSVTDKNDKVFNERK